MDSAESPAFSVNHDQLPQFSGYKALENSKRQIRLLSISPCESDLSCKIVHSSLDNCPSYYALSYCWGEQCEMRPITIGVESVLLRKPVWEFLVSVKYLEKPKPIYLWLDVLCINQRDIGERNAQVKLMGDIYQTATKTYAWLGPLSPSISACLNGIDEALASDVNNAQIKRPEIAENMEATMEVPYWTRKWIIQELVFSKNVSFVCGHRSVSLDDLDQALGQKHSLSKRCSREAFKNREIFLGIRGIRSNVLKGLHTSLTSLRSLMLSFAESQCTDVRDHMYALLGMSNPNDRKMITINYRLSPLEVFLDYVSRFDTRPGRFWLEATMLTQMALRLEADVCINAIKMMESFHYSQPAFLIGKITTLNRVRMFPNIDVRCNFLVDGDMDLVAQNCNSIYEVFISDMNNVSYGPVLLYSDVKILPDDLCVEATRPFVIRKTGDDVSVIGIIEDLPWLNPDHSLSYEKCSSRIERFAKYFDSRIMSSRYHIDIFDHPRVPPVKTSWYHPHLGSINIPDEYKWMSQLEICFSAAAMADMFANEVERVGEMTASWYTDEAYHTFTRKRKTAAEAAEEPGRNIRVWPRPSGKYFPKQQEHGIASEAFRMQWTLEKP